MFKHLKPIPSIGRAGAWDDVFLFSTGSISGYGSEVNNEGRRLRRIVIRSDVPWYHVPGAFTHEFLHYLFDALSPWQDVQNYFDRILDRFDKPLFIFPFDTWLVKMPGISLTIWNYKKYMNIDIERGW